MEIKFFRRIEFMTYIDADISRIYETLTTGQGWDQWFTKGTEVDLNRKSIHLRWKDLGPHKITADEKCKILNLKRNELFSFSWHGNVLEKPTTVIIRLRPQGKGTLVTLSDEGYPKTQRGEDMFMDCSAGWGEAMTLLKVYMETGYQYRNVNEEAEETIDVHH